MEHKNNLWILFRIIAEEEEVPDEISARVLETITEYYRKNKSPLEYLSTSGRNGDNK